MSEWTFRLAEPADAPALAKWVAENTQIDPADLMASLKKQNPTVVYFVATKDGKIVGFAPAYAQMLVPHLAFDPESEGKDRLKALDVLKDGLSGFAVQYGVRELVVMSKEEYPVAQWALHNGFEMDPRQSFKLDLNRVMAATEV